MAEIKKVQTAADGTRKFLFQLADARQIETVFMMHDYGNSICVSSQAGCSMGCAFCASGLIKKERDLKAEEMLEQVFGVYQYLSEEIRDPLMDGADTDSERCSLLSEETRQKSVLPISHLVVMGTGEPFDNYEEVLKFCDSVSDSRKIRQYFKASAFVDTKFVLDLSPEEIAVAPRHITVSTCGLLPKITEFSTTEKRYNLAISLHASNDEIRNRLMPVNRKYPIRELIRTADSYSLQTKRRVTLEYILLQGINDSDACAAELAELLSDPELVSSAEHFYVNLIPYNSVSEFSFRGSSKERALSFYDILMKHGIRATIRKEHGSDIAAACGQLRAGLEG